ncbi:DUF502 domain-containing protein [Lentisphaerota bacterium WC36G]|nr:DUF502 domain-containing protein [Lentisphaerae bacterium WC36]
MKNHNLKQEQMQQSKLRFIGWLRNRLVAGILIVAPVLITLWVVKFAYTETTDFTVEFVNNYAKGYLEKIDVNVKLIEPIVRFLTLGFIIAILILIGQLTYWKLGQVVLKTAEKIILKIPLLSTVYSTCHQIGEALSPRGGMFRKVVMFEYPRKGMWAIGFVTNENKGETSEELKEVAQEDSLISIFVPTTPNPTSGFLLLVPSSELHYLKISVSDGMRLVVSGGAVTPHDLKKAEDQKKI